jgi:hypothetical protein
MRSPAFMPAATALAMSESLLPLFSRSAEDNCFADFPNI